MIGCSELNIGLCVLEVWCSNREGEMVLARFAPFFLSSVSCGCGGWEEKCQHLLSNITHWPWDAHETPVVCHAINFQRLTWSSLASGGLNWWREQRDWEG